MLTDTKSQRLFWLTALIFACASSGLAAQSRDEPVTEPGLVVTGTRPPALAELSKGPVIKGMISAKSGNTIHVTVADGTRQAVVVTDETNISASGGFLGIGKNKVGARSLLNGLPVTVETAQWEGGLVARRIAVQNKDIRFASMIHNGTDQRFGEQAAATEALRGRMADIDQYNIKGTTNVNFDTGKAVLTRQAKDDLCSAATSAEAMNNALLLVVGYTDSTGSQEYNQVLSEKRATAVVNHLQQACHWKPYRMLTPTGMAEADPAADNSTPEGKAQNRRVSVNVLVSKGLDGL